MVVEDNKLIINDELNDEMIEELKEQFESVDEVIIETDNITSLALQQLFCVSNEKKVIVNNSFIAKFFEDIHYV